MEGISKDFDGVQALQDARIAVATGEVHALLGENGAGKSTLIKIVCGALQRDAGTIRWAGDPLELHKPSDATAVGIRVIHQHLSVIDHLSVRENLTLGTERTRLGFIDRRESRDRASHALARLGANLDLDRSVGSLRIAEKQLVEIARAISLDARLLIMDEPTASLGDREADALFDVIGVLRKSGVAVVYISHRLEEVLRLADRITVLRDGRTVGTVDAREIDREQLVQMMVGRPPSHASRVPVDFGRTILEVDEISTDAGLSDVSLELRAGEILGVYGLLGSGRTELARALCGADRVRSGSIRVDGKPVTFRSPRDGRSVGVGLVPEDRTAQALFAQSSVRENVTSASEDLISRWGWINSSVERRLAEGAVEDLRIRTPSIEQRVALLSGGNQQKVVLGRWLIRSPLVLVLDDPTVGVDVGAKDEIYRIIGEMTSAGTGVLLISSDLPELLALSDRTIVLHEGRVSGSLDGRNTSQEDILHLATGAG
ncbi:MAG: sugar ABC transporter ATP-binding protein [Chloroflexota bacterium]|nr:sugar ABC transporter ATP-binding protein [Chloroflexota bacterium]